MKNFKNKTLLSILFSIILAIPIIYSISFTDKIYIANSLEKKYNEKFKIVSIQKKGLFTDYNSAVAYSKEYQDIYFSVYINKKNKKTGDNYASKRLCNRIKDKITDNLKSLNNKYYVNVDLMLEEQLITNTQMSLSEFAEQEKHNIFNITLLIEKNNIEETNIVTSIINMLNELPQFNGNIYLYFIDNRIMNNAIKYLESHDKIYEEFNELTSDYYIGTINFYNSKISFSKITLNQMLEDNKK